MVEEGLVLEMDIIEHNHKKELEQKEKEVTEKVTKEVTKEVTTYTACNMLRKGLSVELVQECTGLSQEEILQLKESLD